MTRARFGALGEDAAADLLRKGGYRIVARNHRCRAGEDPWQFIPEQTTAAIVVHHPNAIYFSARRSEKAVAREARAS